MTMYFKDKSEILKVRITQEQDEFLMSMCVQLGLSKSELTRIIIDSYRSQWRKFNENKQTDFNN